MKSLVFCQVIQAALLALAPITDNAFAADRGLLTPPSCPALLDGSREILSLPGGEDLLRPTQDGFWARHPELRPLTIEALKITDLSDLGDLSANAPTRGVLDRLARMRWRLGRVIGKLDQAQSMMSDPSALFQASTSDVELTGRLIEKFIDLGQLAKTQEALLSEKFKFSVKRVSVDGFLLLWRARRIRILLPYAETGEAPTRPTTP